MTKIIENYLQVVAFNTLVKEIRSKLLNSSPDNAGGRRLIFFNY